MCYESGQVIATVDKPGKYAEQSQISASVTLGALLFVITK